MLLPHIKAIKTHFIHRTHTIYTTFPLNIYTHKKIDPPTHTHTLIQRYTHTLSQTHQVFNRLNEEINNFIRQ